MTHPNSPNSPKGALLRHGYTLHKDTDEGAHTPAQSVTINSRAGLLALREVIDEALRLPEPATTGAPQ